MGKNGEGIAIYSRKSRFTGKGESIGNQVELCKEYIRAHYGEAALEHIAVYEDEGFSGGDLNRPAFKRMMEAARQRRCRAIIVYRLDRISRNISDFARLIEELARLDVAFISLKEQFDTGTPMGRAMMYIASVFSQLERETIAERIRDNMHELAKTGRWLGGVTPTGYASESVRSVTVDGRTKRSCKLKLIAEEAETVKTIFGLYLETGSQTVTEAELIKRGIRTKNHKYFTRFSIRGILQNPVYMIADEEAYRYFVRVGADLFSDREAFDGVHGMMAYNRTCQEKGKATEYLPPSEWIVAVGLHPGIIPGRAWVEVQESLERNRSRAYHKPRSNEALLTGLLYCRCGGRMYPKLSQRRTADGAPAYSYVCKQKERSRGSLCGGRNADGNALDRAVLERLGGLREDEDAFAALLERSRRSCAAGTPQEERLAALRQEKAETERKLGALADSLAELESAARGAVARRMEELARQGRELARRIRETEELSAPHERGGAELAELGRRLAALPAALEGMSVEQKRAALRSLVRRAVWDGGSLHVTLFGAEEDGPGGEKAPWGEDSK